jgi:PhnB protein
MKLNTFLNYGGNCREAFLFYEKHLGGKINFLMTQADQPGKTDVPPELKDMIIYINMSIGGTELMGSDFPDPSFQPMRSVYLSLGVDTSEEAERIYALLSEGGQIFMPMQETFYAHKFAMVRDRFGTSWMILHQRPMPPAA